MKYIIIAIALIPLIATALIPIAFLFAACAVSVAGEMMGEME